jgi:hypothetical protein
MALTETDAVIIELYDNPLTQRKDDRYGRVVNIASINEDTLIERAIENGYNGNRDTMLSNYQAMKREALKAAARGEIVQFGLGHTALSADGPFFGDAPKWNPEVNSLAARISPIKQLREMLKEIPVRVLGLAPEQSAIATVTDVASGKTNECLTPGGMANIKGSRIRIAGDKPGVGLFLYNQDTETTVEIAANSIGLNDPSSIMFVIPADLESGNYQISIVTQFSGNTSRPYNDPHTITLSYLLSVG